MKEILLPGSLTKRNYIDYSGDYERIAANGSCDCGAPVKVTECGWKQGKAVAWHVQYNAASLQGEPVAWQVSNPRVNDGRPYVTDTPITKNDLKVGWVAHPLFAAPQPAERVTITERELGHILVSMGLLNTIKDRENLRKALIAEIGSKIEVSNG